MRDTRNRRCRRTDLDLRRCVNTKPIYPYMSNPCMSLTGSASPRPPSDLTPNEMKNLRAHTTPEDKIPKNTRLYLCTVLLYCLRTNGVAIILAVVPDVIHRYDRFLPRGFCVSLEDSAYSRFTDDHDAIKTSQDRKCSGYAQSISHVVVGLEY